MRLTISAGILLASLLIAPITVAAQEFGVEDRKAVQYGIHDGAALVGDLYLPKGTVNRPGLPQSWGCQVESSFRTRRRSGIRPFTGWVPTEEIGATPNFEAVPSLWVQATVSAH
jgi:hypothetical protein